MIAPKQCRVAVFIIHTRPFHLKMFNLLLDQIATGVQGIYSPVAYRVSIDPEGIKAKARDIIHRNLADVIITMGKVCSLATQEVLDEVGGFPALFVGVRNPLGEGLIASYDRPGKSMTGALRESAPSLAVAEKFACFFPAVRAVFIPYSAADTHLIQQAMEIKKYLTVIGMQVFAVPIEDDESALMKLIDEYSSRVQAIIFLEGCYSNALQESVAYYCWEKCLVFCGSGMSAIGAGASCAFGGDINQVARDAYQLLREFWEKGTPISILPVRVARDNQEFYVNIDMLRRIDVPTEIILKICSQSNVKVLRKWTKPFKD